MVLLVPIEESHALLHSKSIGASACYLSIPFTWSFHIHGNIRKQVGIEQLCYDLRSAAIGIQFDCKPKIPDTFNEGEQVSLQRGFTAAYHHGIYETLSLQQERFYLLMAYFI